MRWPTGVVAALFATLVVWAPPSTKADVATDPLRVIGLDLGTGDDGEPNELRSIHSISPNGRFVVLATSGSSFHLDLETGTLTRIALDGSTPTDDGLSVYVTDNVNSPFFEEIIVTEAVGSLLPVNAPPAQTVELGYDDRWTTPIVVETTDDGRYQLLNARIEGSNEVRYVVYDTVTEAPITPLDGLPEPAASNRVLDARFVDGSTIDYFTMQNVSAVFESYERLDFLRGESTTVTTPAAYAGFPWDVSDNGEWVAFYTSEAGVIDGLDGSPRLYRRHLETGATDVVPIDSGRVKQLLQFDVFDDGLVAYDVRYRDPGNPLDGSLQAFGWTTPGTAARLVITDLGGDVTRVESGALVWNASGSVVAFASDAVDLVDDVDGPPGTARLYVIDGRRTEVEEPPPTPGGLREPAVADERSVRCSMSPAC